MLDFDAMAGVEPAFDPTHFTIDPHNLPAGAHALAEGIAEGYAPGAAVTLLQHDSATAHVSFDRMLALTEHDLGALKGADAVAGKSRFDATIETRLGNGNAEIGLANAVHLGELTPTVAAATVVAMAKAVTPGPHEIAHDLALFIHDLQVDKVAASSIDAVAKAQANAILSGVAEQVLLGGDHAPVALDLAAAAKVVEQHLPTFTTAAEAKLDALVQHLDDTRAERAVLHQIETQALKDALADHRLTKAQEKPWTTAFALPNEHLDKVDRQVLAIAAQLAAGKITSDAAFNEMGTLAEAQPVHGHLPTGDDLINALAPKLTFDDPRDGAFAELAGDTMFAAAVPIVAKLFHLVSTPPKGEEIEAASLAGVARAGLAFEAVTDAQVTKAFAKAAPLADLDQWLMAAVGTLGGRNGIGNTDANVETYLPVGHTMFGELISGKLAAHLASAVRHDEMTYAQAVDFADSFGALAMNNAGWPGGVDDFNFVPHLTQVDGITDSDRAGLAVVQFMHDMGNKDAAPIQRYVVAHHVDDYLTGLGSYGALMGGTAVTQDIETASNVIEKLAMPFVKAAHNNGADNQTILDTAESQLSSYENLYVTGLSDVSNVAAGVLGKDAPLGLGSLGSGLNLLTDPTLANFDSFAYSAFELGPENPIGEVGAVAHFAQFALDNLGIGKLLGPFAGSILDGAVGAIAETSDFVDNALVGTVSPLINGLGAPIVHAIQNLGNLGKDLFSGDFAGAAGAAGQLVTDIGNDLAKVGNEIVKVFVDPLGALEDAANVLDSIAQSIANSINTMVNDIVSVADDIKDFFDSIF